VEILVLHYTGMPSAEGALSWLCDPRSQVSSHYFVFEDGEVAQLVPEDRRAWHAGLSCWRGQSDVNSRSVGIEIANPGHEFGYRPFPAVQVEAVARLCRAIVDRHAIEPRNVVAHSDIAPLRKEDPGELFPWAYLARFAGVGLTVQPAPIDRGPVMQEGDAGPSVQGLQSMLAAYGYDVPVSGEFCAHTAAVIRAFQRHFRPERVDGVADASTVETLRRLLATISAEG
jgi:N-acetylmuramoyl-L-alanine amidase